jgi:hypothetical protein
LYGIEKLIRGRPPEERQRIRQEQAQPLLNAMKDWMKGLLPTLSRKSDLTGAIHYALGRWSALTRYATDELLPTRFRLNHDVVQFDPTDAFPFCERLAPE